MAGQCFGSDGAPPQVVWFLILLLCLLQYEYDYDVNGDRVVLGKGTYGIVFAGRDLSNQVRIAIKEIPERDSRQVSAGLPCSQVPPPHPTPGAQH